jgi:hypothetical protein
MKTCNKCKQEKDLGEFYPDSYQSDGLKTFCKACDNAQSRAYWQKVKSKLTKSQKQARRDAYKRWKERQLLLAK